MELINELLAELTDELLTELIDELLLELLDETTLELMDDGDGFDGELEPPPPHPTMVPPEMAKHRYRPIFDRIIKHLGFWLLVIRNNVCYWHTWP